MKFLLVAFAYGLIFVVLEAVAHKLRPPAELARKLGHIIAGIAAALLPFVLNYKEIALLGALFVPAVLVSMKFGVFKSVHGVNRKTYGEVYFPLAICLSALLFPDQLLYTYAVLTLGVSDALASLVGIRYGRRKYRVRGGHKSYEGSIAFFVSTLVIGGGLLVALVPNVSVVSVCIWSTLLAAVLTLVEARGHTGADNLFVPLAAAGLLGLLRAFAVIGN
jgi:phytol kinase